MNFHRYSRYAEVSDCGRYTVSSSSVQGVWAFTAWRRAAFTEAAPTMLGIYPLAPAARDRCASDAYAQKAAA